MQCNSELLVLGKQQQLRLANFKSCINPIYMFVNAILECIQAISDMQEVHKQGLYVLSLVSMLPQKYIVM